MKTFKQFFKENTPDINITATPPGGQPAQLGTVDSAQAKKIANYVGRVSSGGEEDIKELIKDSRFDTGGGDYEKNKYYQVFDYLLYNEKYKINWKLFKQHVAKRFTKNNLQ